jgi:CheY-like chemotaxis protein
MNLKTIYLADDDADDRYLICEAIKQVDSRIDVVESENGSDLLICIQKENLPLPTLIVLDMNMPKMNGLETLRAIRSNPLHAHIPTVMISTSSDAKLIESAHYEGIDGFITKPNSFEGFILLARQLTNDYLKG